MSVPALQYIVSYFRFQMLVPKLLLSLIFGIAAADQFGESDALRDADDTNAFRGDTLAGGFETYRASIGTRQANVRRHKRGMPSVLRASG